MSDNKRPTLHLKAQDGTDEANFGTERYRVDNDGTVEVPHEAAAGLLLRGGFSVAEPTQQTDSAGLTLVAHPDGAGASWDGTVYEPDASGSISVPVEAVADLEAHGFVPVATEDAPPARSARKAVPARDKKAPDED